MENLRLFKFPLYDNASIQPGRPVALNFLKHLKPRKNIATKELTKEQKAFVANIDKHLAEAWKASIKKTGRGIGESI